ncbi:MAG: hypothetical protein OEX76_00680 [Candidatus Bathyarchaeota archaeon]|nr:hypothetical protein [Candidatus Bathyarchaeota archaeon]
MRLVSVLPPEGYLRGFHELVTSVMYRVEAHVLELLLETCSKADYGVDENDKNW